jgi:hypothetical protein
MMMMITTWSLEGLSIASAFAMPADTDADNHVTEQVDLRRCCPMDRQPVAHAMLRSCRRSAQAVATLPVRCRYGVCVCV